MTEISTISSRLLYVDFLRGIAVLGLLLMNTSSMGLLPDGAGVGDTFVEQLLAIVKTFMLDGRFRSIFCLLLGIGLYLQFTRYQRFNLQSIKLLKSRLHWLFIFGLCHCVFLWHGDILMLYALSGLIVIKRLEDTSEQLLKRGCLYFAIGMVMRVFLSFGLRFFELDSLDMENDSNVLSYQELYTNNIFVAVGQILSFPLSSMFELCGVMFIGIALFRNGTLQRGFTVFQLWGLAAVTIVFSLVAFFLSNISTGIVIEYLSSVSGLTMALLFWHWVLKSKCYDKESILVSSVRALGRRPLSFYIFQSLVITTMLRFIFPQWNAEFNSVNYFILALAFIPIQLFIAYYYDRYYTQGPLEYLWRHLVSKRSIIRNNKPCNRH
ncbi:hypothetical protein AB835_10725 [Candidatus Endobugula sertula]|uniref:DUF418 domain-containing protein n=1 Tax=Candidatus Endobugula sertula TaxID=62101 RepID=A0A1D2QNA8_9GAMM|nr:hypothetical protein AB835_10725 [Candidatus Endobugula sertula]